MSPTNETTQKIIAFFLEDKRGYGRRHGVSSGTAEYTNKNGDTRTRYIHAGITGGSDIFVWLPPDPKFPGSAGRFLGIEIKTGKDRLRPEQIGFIRSLEIMGSPVWVVKDFEDFKKQWTTFLTGCK